MQITCPGCHFSREIPDGKAPPNATLATCPKCKLKFKFREASAPRPAAPVHSAAPETPDAGDGRDAPFGGGERGRQERRPSPRLRDEAAQDEAPRLAAPPVAEDDYDEILPLRETLASSHALPETHARMGEDVLDYAIAEEQARSAPPRPLSSRKPVSPEDADALMGGPPVEPIAPPATYVRELAEAGLVDMPEEAPEEESGAGSHSLFEELTRSFSENPPRDELADDAPRPPLAADRLISAFEESAEGRRRHPLADTFLPPEKGRGRAARAEAKPKRSVFGKFRPAPEADDAMDIPGLSSQADEPSTARRLAASAMFDPADAEFAGDADESSFSRPSKDDARDVKDDAERRKRGKKGVLAGLFRRPPATPEALAQESGDDGLAIPGLRSASPASTVSSAFEADEVSSPLPGQRRAKAAAGQEADDALSIPGLRRSSATSASPRDSFAAEPNELTIPGLGEGAGKSSPSLELDDGELAIPGLRRSPGRSAARSVGGFGEAEPDLGVLEIPGLRHAEPEATPGPADPMDDDRPRPSAGGGFLDRLLGRGASGAQADDIWQDLENLGEEDEAGSFADGPARAEPAPWEDPRRGLIGGFLGTAAGAMFAPARFFGRLSLDGGLGRPMLFVAVLAEILALVHFLLNSVGMSTSALLGAGPFFDFGLGAAGGLGAGGLAAFATYPLAAVAALTLLAMYRFGMLTLVGSSEGGFSGAVRVLAYGASPFILLAAPVLGLPLALPWVMAVTVIGFKAANRTSYARVAVACVLPDFLAVFLFLYAALSAGVIP